MFNNNNNVVFIHQDLNKFNCKIEKKKQIYLTIAKSDKIDFLLNV